MKTIIINGSGGTGKTTFCSLCSEFARVYSYSSVEDIKRIAQMIGWDGVSKTEEDRKFLSDLKLICSDYCDLPMRSMMNHYQRLNVLDTENEIILFYHVREVDEVYRTAIEFNAKTLLIRNPNVPKITSNEADANVENYEYDYIINNDGTIDDLRQKAKEFVNTIMGE